MVKFKSKLWVRSIVEVAHTEPNCVLTGGVSVKQLLPVANALPFVTNCPNVVKVEMTKSINASVNRISRKYNFLIQ
jgi:hypothetical protein